MVLTILLGIGCESNISKLYEIDLKHPMILEELHVWRDGGSLGFVMKDADGKRICFCLDGNVSSTTAGFFFVNVTYPTYNGSLQLSLDGNKERKILTHLRSWLETNFDLKELDKTFRSKSVGELTRDEFEAWHVKHLLDNRADVVKELKETIQPTDAPDKK
jgi:hypothetical protein